MTVTLFLKYHMGEDSHLTIIVRTQAEYTKRVHRNIWMQENWLSQLRILLYIPTYVSFTNQHLFRIRVLI